MEYPKSLGSVCEIPNSVRQDGLREKGVRVVRGLDNDLIDQLIKQSATDKVVRQFCPNDQASRFSSAEAIKQWAEKGRLVMPLVADKEGRRVISPVKRIGAEGLKLVGIGWMGPGRPGEDEPFISGATTTFAIRLYEEARGQRLALPYTQAMLDAHAALFENDGVWLETWGDNKNAVKTYREAGFKEVARRFDLKRNADRLYMTLGDIAAQGT